MMTWLDEVKTRFPVNTRVRIIAADIPAYVGATGYVADYDPGADGDYPLIGVVFDTPIEHTGKTHHRDGFYDEELEIVV